MTQQPDPHEALASIRDARAGVGKTLDYPVGWDLVYGLILAVIVGGSGLPQPWSVLTLAASMCALALMVRWWRNRVGWWVSGYSPPRARWVAVGMAAVLLGLVCLSLWPSLRGGPSWAPILAAGLAFITGVVGGRLWMQVFRQEIAMGDR